MTNTAPNSRKRYANTAETAAYVRYTPNHLRALVRAGKFPKPMRPYGPGGKCIWDLDEVDGHLHAPAVEQTAA
jgi:hypothetical protein